MNSFDHLKSTYFQECGELLDSTYAHLAAIEDGSGDDETIHAIFRAIHSIKGGGGAFGFERLVSFAHVLETVLDLLRDRKLGLSADILRLLVRSSDALSDLVAAARIGGEALPDVEAALAAALEEVAEKCAGAASESPRVQADPVSPAGPTPAASRRRWAIRFSPHADLFRTASEPLLIIRELKRLGSVAVTADIARLPPFETMDPSAAYLAWQLVVESESPPASLEEVFAFVVDDSEVEITELAVDGDRRSDAPAQAQAQAQAQAPAPAAARASANPPPPVAGTAPSGGASIRIDVEKIDRLVNLVGELVINQSMLVQLGSDLPSEQCGGLLAGLETMSQHLRELQEGVMAMRAQPVKSVFSRMSRLVRELAGQLGKEVRLTVRGETTEIDKTMIEQLADPLTHLLRNALDHGIEPPADREAAGKPRCGSISLSAEHRGGRIVIEVSDDGRGIARDKVLAKAQSRGLIAPDALLSDEELDNIIFLPGFSTAETISDVSGRGVGMDVVKRNIQALGGRITVASHAGRGSSFMLSLPLTLAILDGMVVAVGRERYIIPLTNIIESLRPQPTAVHAVVGRGDVVTIRGQYIPLVPLHRRFSVDDAETDPCRGIVVIVESEGAQRIGLVVDELVGQQQVVVKSLEANYGSVVGVGGATILGDGRVALILDVGRLDEAVTHGRPAERRLSPPYAGAQHLH